MVICIGQIACHSAIQQPGCAVRTANTWGVFISFFTIPWEKKTKTTTSSTQMVTWVFLVFKLYVWKTTEKCKRQYTIKNHLKICCCYSLCSPTQKIPKYFPSFLVSIDSISHTTSFPKSSNSETLKNHRPQLNNHVGEYPDSALNHQF